MRVGIISTGIMGSAMASPYIKIKGEKILKQDFSKQFALSLMTKDLRLIIEKVLKHRFPSFLGSVCYDVYQQAEIKGLGDVDLSAVKKMYEKK
ncbi:MAG: NAD(P)-dependent oxidoreductase [Candidatus Hydrothermae bacterium]|nr:NAD(P)-dependent oxidoreductase [Candidatus Hydrothermae bacterium]